MQYSQYLQSPHWKELRAKKLASCGHCQICGVKEKLHIHHGRYKLAGDWVGRAKKRAGNILGREETSDLFVFCASCHRLWHAHYKKDFPRHKTLSKIRRLVNLSVVPSEAIKISNTPAYSVVLEVAKRRFKAAQQ